MECGVREFTLNEEIEIYKKEAKELFDNEQEGCEAPFANCIVRRGMRIISKSKEIREKFTPKKPIIGDTFTSKFQESIIKTGKYTDIASYQSYKCPVCQQSIIMFWEAERNEKIYGCKCNENFCKKCGQALDWSD